MGRGKAEIDLMKEINVATRGDLPKHCGDLNVDMENAMGVKAYESSGGGKYNKIPLRDFERGGKNKFEDGDMEVKASKLWIVPVGLGTGFIGSDVANRLQDRRREKYDKELKDRGE